MHGNEPLFSPPSKVILLKFGHQHCQTNFLFGFRISHQANVCYCFALYFNQQIMNSRPEIDVEGPYRLLYCSSKGDREGVMQELEKGVEPNLADYDKRTALHLASCEGCTEIVVLLLEKGADVNSVDRWGRTVSSVPSA